MLLNIKLGNNNFQFVPPKVPLPSPMGQRYPSTRPKTPSHSALLEQLNYAQQVYADEEDDISRSQHCEEGQELQKKKPIRETLFTDGSLHEKYYLVFNSLGINQGSTTSLP